MCSRPHMKSRYPQRQSHKKEIKNSSSRRCCCCPHSRVSQIGACMDIKDFLSPAATLIGVRATDKVGLLQDLVNRLALPLNSPSNLVSAALLKRETLLQGQSAQARNAGTKTA